MKALRTWRRRTCPLTTLGVLLSILACPPSHADADAPPQTVPVQTAPAETAILSPSPPESTGGGPTLRDLTPVVLPPGEKSSLITSFTPTVHEIRNPASGFLHPGIFATKGQLDTMQRHVRSGDQPWASAFAAFSQVPNCGTNPQINYAGWTDIPRGGGLGKGGNYVTFRMAKDANTAYKQVVMWYITGDETYRLNALKIIRDYCAIKTVAPHWDAQIRWGVASYQLCCAAEVLRYSEGNTAASQWTDDDTAQFSALMKAGEGLVAPTGYWMNQHGFSTMGEMGTAIFLDDKPLYEEAVERTTVNSRGQPGGRNGSIQWQMRLVTENFLTHEKVTPQVQVVEMIRDQPHAWINVAVLSTCCQTIYNQGTKVDPVTGTVSTAANAVDAFDFLDNRLLAGADYITRYTIGEPVSWIPIDMGDHIKGDPGKFYDLGILYNHYKYIEQWSTHDPRFHAVAQAYESVIPETDAIDFPGASTLLLTPDNAFQDATPTPMPSSFGHPIIPDLIADPSIVELNGTFYCYATTDGTPGGLSASGLPVVWESKDFVNWRFNGSLFSSDFDAKYWAPSSLRLKDGRYYLFPTLDEKITALVADAPEGPFRTLDGKDITKTSGWRPFPIHVGKPIDAEVFIDDDGAAYMVWAQRGFGKLTPDFSGFEGEQTVIPTKREGYSEGPYIFKRNGIYYYLYTLGGHENYQYAYMMSHSPLGPWVAPEQDIIATTDHAQGIYGPGHGCFFHPTGSGQWYFAYLEFGRGGTNRQVWVDKMNFNVDGTIQPIQLTLQGAGALAPAFNLDEPNLALGATATASSILPDYNVRPIADPTLHRVENYLPVNAVDGCNGTRWMALKSDTNVWFQLDLGQARQVNRTEVYFVFPTGGHAYRLEYSLDGETWQTYGDHPELVVESPHTDVKFVRARYLKLTILQGTPGLWEFKVY